MGELREHLLWLLRGGQAHIGFEGAVADISAHFRGSVPANLPYSPWRILEHMRIAQWDILEFSRNPDHVSPDFPDGYWPKGTTPPNETSWNASIDSFRFDAEELQELIMNPDQDLMAPFEWGDGQTLLREALLVADHNAYHIGQLIAVRRALGAWTD